MPLSVFIVCLLILLARYKQSLLFEFDLTILFYENYMNAYNDFSTKSTKKKLYQMGILWDKMVILTFHLSARLVHNEIKSNNYDQFQFT